MRFNSTLSRDKVDLQSAVLEEIVNPVWATVRGVDRDVLADDNASKTGVRDQLGTTHADVGVRVDPATAPDVAIELQQCVRLGVNRWAVLVRGAASPSVLGSWTPRAAVLSVVREVRGWAVVPNPRRGVVRRHDDRADCATTAQAPAAQVLRHAKPRCLPVGTGVVWDGTAAGTNLRSWSSREDQRGLPASLAALP